MLRHKGTCINDFPVNVIFELMLKNLTDNLECISSVMVHQVLDILQQKSLWLCCRDNSSNIKKECPLRGAFKAMRAAKSIFLAHTSNREWLAWKAC